MIAASDEMPPFLHFFPFYTPLGCPSLVRMEPFPRSGNCLDGPRIAAQLWQQAQPGGIAEPLRAGRNMGGNDVLTQLSATPRCTTYSRPTLQSSWMGTNKITITGEACIEIVMWQSRRWVVSGDQSTEPAVGFSASVFRNQIEFFRQLLGLSKRSWRMAHRQDRLPRFPPSDARRESTQAQTGW